MHNGFTDFSLREVSMKIMRAAHMTVNAESVLVYIVDDTDHHHELVRCPVAQCLHMLHVPDTHCAVRWCTSAASLKVQC